MNLDDHIDKYLYVRNNPWWRRIISFFALVSLFSVMYGFYRFFHLSTWYWIIFGPIVFVFFINRFIRYFIQMFYPKFDIEKHELKKELYWLKNKEPSVNIFLPIFGEDPETVKRTWDAVKAIDYKNVKVFVLDDGANTELEAIARAHKFTYLSRPNKGEYGKAGNLRFGYENSKGDFVLVLDADFVPHKDFLKETIPYMQDEKIGILQTPQYFNTQEIIHENSPIEFGGGNVVEEFYQYDMPSRDLFGASMCVGTSAIYRRKAILEAGGPPKVWGTEDVRQGLLIKKYGYNIKYLPIILSIGLSPETPDRYFRQHHRWCKGSVEVIFQNYFWEAKLSLFARFIYLANPTYYFSEALSPILNMSLPILLLFHFSTLNIVNFLWFLPYAIISRIILPYSRIVKPKLGTFYAAYNNIYTYLYTIPNMIVRVRDLHWQPAGTKVGIVARGYRSMVALSTLVVLINFSVFLYAYSKVPTNYFDVDILPVAFWGAFNLFFQILFLLLSFNFVYKIYLKEHPQPRAFTKYYLNFQRTLPVIFFLVLFGMIGYSFYKSPKTFSQNLANQTEIKIQPSTTGTISEEAASTDIISEPQNSNVLGEATVAPTQTPVPTAIPTTSPSVTPTQEKIYSYTVQPGEYRVILARRAMNQYLSEKNLSLLPEQKLYVETNLSIRSGVGPLSPGSYIQFYERDLEELVQKARNLTPLELVNWRRYL